MRLRFQKGDILAVVIVFALALTVALQFIPGREETATVVEIYREGQLIHSMPLSQDGDFTVVGVYTNIVTVSDGGVCISCSDCPGGDCVNSGTIRSVGRCIVCLPNSVEIRITGRPDDVDFVVG